MLNALKTYYRRLNLKLNPNMMLACAYLALAFGLTYNPFLNIGVTDFSDRQIGQALINGIDSSVRINHLLIWSVVLIPLLFLAFWCVTSKLCKAQGKALSFLNKLSAVSLVPLVLGYINRFAGSFRAGYDITIPLVMIMLTVVFMVFENKLSLNFDDAKWSIFSSLPLITFFYIAAKRLGISMSPKRLALAYFIICIFLFILFSLFTEKLRLNKYSIQRGFVWVVFAPVATSVFLEACNILNRHNIFITRKYLGAFIIWAFLFAICVIYCLISNRKPTPKAFFFEKVYYPLIILGLVLISVQMPLEFTQAGTAAQKVSVGFFEVNFFESSNAASAISGFFNFGELPLIQNFDAHMLYSEWSGFLYAFLNNDVFGALFNPYKPYIIILVYMLLYFIYSEFFDSDSALLVCMLMSCATAYIDYYALGIISIAGVLYASRKKTFLSCTVMWVLLIVCCLMRLDLGFPFAVGCVICLVILTIKDNLKPAKLLISLGTVLGVCGIVCLSICFIKGINPIDRAFEFLDTASSNTNWSTASIGEPSEILFPICYILTPLTAMGLFIALCYKYFKEKGFAANRQLIISVILFFAYIANISRGIVRHSLNEHQVKYVLGTFILFFSFAVYLLCKRKRLLNFVAGYFSVFLLFTVLMTGAGYITTKEGYIIDSASLFEASLTVGVKAEAFDEAACQKVSRVRLNSDTQKYINDINAVFDILMEKDGTYLDFTDNTLIYALTNRQKPVYVNQSPGLLSGEKAQQRFLSQIESYGDRIEYALLCTDNNGAIDGINNTYRYYLVSEYINKNFAPLCSFDGLEVWCKKSQFNEKQAMLLQSISNDASLDFIAVAQKPEIISGKENQYNLMYLPYYWANLDSIPLGEKQVLTVLSEGETVNNGNTYKTAIDTSKIDKSQGNYICVTFTASQDCEILMSLNGENVSDVYRFKAVSGDNISYLVRVSCSYLWYRDLFTELTVFSDCDIKNLSISVLKGDVLA